MEIINSYLGNRQQDLSFMQNLNNNTFNSEEEESQNFVSKF